MSSSNYYVPRSSTSSTTSASKLLRVAFFFTLIGVVSFALYINVSMLYSIRSPPSPPSPPNADDNDGKTAGKEESAQQRKSHIDSEHRNPTFLPGHDLLIAGNNADDDGGGNDDDHCAAAAAKLQQQSLSVCSVDDLLKHQNRFFLLREEKSKRFLARPLDTNRQSSGCRDKIFRIHPRGSKRSSTSTSFTIQGSNRMFLSFEHNDRLTVNRLWARSYEAWLFHFDASSCTFSLQSAAPEPVNHRYVSVLGATRALETVEASASHAARWRLVPVTWCSGEDECWGEDMHAAARRSEDAKSNKLPPPAPHKGPLRDSVDTLPQYKTARFPLFGSPKPLQASTPLKPGDAFDTVVIAERTIRNWAAMDGMVPVMFSTDANTVKIVDRVNAEIDQLNSELRHDGCDPETSSVPRHLRKHKTIISGDFETKSEYNNQPTYRGLFKRAFEMYPDAPAVMYSNGDILFSPTLAQTIRYVASYFEREKGKQQQQQQQQRGQEHEDDDDADGNNDGGGGKKRNKKRNKKNKNKRGGANKLRGWMIVGQRINCVVPGKFYLKDSQDSRYASCSTMRKMVDDFAAGASSGNSTAAMAAAMDVLVPQWVNDVERYAGKGELFQGNAEDYFIVSRDLFDWDKVPEFIVGGVAFDNWITSRGVRLALNGEAIVVDAVKTITALHQNDDVNIKKSHMSPKSRFNLRLASQHGGVGDGYTSDAPLATEKLPDGTVTIYDKYALLFH